MITVLPVAPWARVSDDPSDQVSFRAPAVPPGRIDVVPPSVMGAVLERLATVSGAVLWVPDCEASEGDVTDDEGNAIRLDLVGRCWVFFVDLEPEYSWEHSCEYWVYSADGSLYGRRSARTPPARETRAIAFFPWNADV